MEERSGCAGDDDIRIANRVMLEGDLPHAAFHVAAALNDAPRHVEVLAVADELYQLSDDPLGLAPLSPETNFAGTIALRARFLQLADRHNEALPLIADLLEHTRRLEYVSWGVRSVEALAERIELDAAIRFIGKTWGLFSQQKPGEAEQKEIAPLARLVEKLEPKFGHSEQFLAHGSFLFRKLGRLHQALAWATRSYGLAPSFVGALAVANTYKEMGDAPETIQWLRTTAQLETGAVSALLDLGDFHLDRREFAEAAATFFEALEKSPGQPWAAPSLLFARSQMEEDAVTWESQLLAYAAENPANERAQTLAANAQLWVGALPEPHDATINALKDLLRGNMKLEGARMAVSHLEAPSCITAGALVWRMRGAAGGLAMSVGMIPKPDPRTSYAEKQFEVWSYRTYLVMTNEPKTSLPAPDAEVLAAVGEIARRKYSLIDWCEAGHALAPRVGAARVRDLLGVMVHPSLPLESFSAWVWVQRLQLASCCTLAYLDTGWGKSLRRRVLFSLLHGPMDWINGAAAIVLSQLALEIPDARAEVEFELWRQLTRVPQQGYCCYLHPLCTAYLRLPGLEPTRAATMRKLRNV